jgi:hypothetical protein
MAEIVTIAPPNFQTAEFQLKGTAPYMQHRFWKKADMMAKHEAGSTARSKSKKSARKFEEEYEAAKHETAEGWVGIPASAFRMALISACRLVGFHMTKAKLSLFIVADGTCKYDGTPLVRIKGDEEMSVMQTRNATGVVDLRARPMWREWDVTLKIEWDADQFTLEDVANLLMRVGKQVGVGEGRPDSKKSAGMGFGTFEILEAA